MIMSILLFIVFLISIGLITVFIFSILIPSINSDKSNLTSEEFLFALDEIRIKESPKKEITDTGKRAVVLCNHDKTFSQNLLNYQGPQDCHIFKTMYETESDCFHQCLGFGSCVDHCPQKAITIVNKTAFVMDGCIGCERCVESCPIDIIKMFPAKEAKNVIPCSNTDCQTSCSACQKERKNLPSKRKVFKIWKICYNIFNKDK